MDEKLRKQYEDLAKKHGLPRFEELDSEFQVSALEDVQLLLPEIIGKMLEKIQTYADFLGEILQPDTNLVNLYESRVLGEPDKKEAYDVFRRLMMWKRRSLDVGLAGNPQAESAFVAGLFAEWKALKPRLAGLVGKIADSWESDSEEVEKLGYFG